MNYDDYDDNTYMRCTNRHLYQTTLFVQQVKNESTNEQCQKNMTKGTWCSTNFPLS